MRMLYKIKTFRIITVNNLTYKSYVSDCPIIKANKLLREKEIKYNFSYTDLLSILCLRRI